MAVGATTAQQKAYIGSGESSIAKVQGLDMGSVKWTDGFWKERFDMTLEAVAPAQYDYFMGFSENNLRQVAEGVKNDPTGFKGTWWQDGDYCKWLEAHIAVYSVSKDPELKKIIDEKAAMAAKAIDDDGYFSTHTSIGHGVRGSKGLWNNKFSDLKRFSTPSLHETYNMGHYLTMACTHYRVMGNRVMLDSAIKIGDFLSSYFGEMTPELAAIDFNQTHLMGLMELYRSTGERKYAETVNRIVTARGNKGGEVMNQNSRKLRMEDEAVGHAVLGPVMYSGALDYATEFGDEALIKAMKRIWVDIYTRKASFTGGIGNVHEIAYARHRNLVAHEAFGERYKIHSSTAYNETCANFYGAYFSWRLFLLTGEAKYLEPMEKVFYNNLSAMALDGKSYFYTNVLRWHGEEHKGLTMDAHERWTESCNCVCCPTSVVRFLAQTKDYAYATDEESLYVTLYGSNSVEKTIGGKRVSFTQKSCYPWKGDVEMEYQGDRNAAFNLKLHIPEWAGGATLAINGETVKTTAGSFATIARCWKRGDRVELKLPMRPRLSEANPLVEELRNQVAVSYGPLTYCAEAIDLPEGVTMDQVMIPANAIFDVAFDKDLLRGVNVITVDALARTTVSDKSKLYTQLESGYKPIKLKMIPYYSWANRGDHAMSIFFPVKW